MTHLHTTKLFNGSNLLQIVANIQYTLLVKRVCTHPVHEKITDLRIKITRSHKSINEAYYHSKNFCYRYTFERTLTLVYSDCIIFSLSTKSRPSLGQDWPSTPEGFIIAHIYLSIRRAEIGSPFPTIFLSRTIVT